ncbi:acyl-CoA dehydrogenase family protein [Methylocapsa sp. S129]|uniref:acyl-CoA dehydrogenase family protein n=1 Tax=Methylocapsa sp. S129 TaxID=1641869 RepID=UPI00131A6C71|nr:acyl-CoA dehydrogenase family protein [Methylocapsa sp. S129]
MTSVASVHTFVAPTSGELVARARELAPLLQRNAPKGEANRRVEEESLLALTKAGLLKVCTPRRYGGWEMNTRAMLDVSAAIAEADGGAAWVANLNNICCWLASLFPVKAQDEVFGANPDAIVSGVLAPSAASTKVAGGLRVTGKWYYNSGGWHAQWAVLGVPIVNDVGETIDQGLALIPMADLEREDTWFVAGMKSSGSIGLIAKDVFIPSHRILSVPSAIEGDYPTEMRGQESFYRSAFVAILALILVGPQLGLGRAALQYVRQKAGTRPISYTFFEKQNASVAFQLQIAQAAMLIDTAHLHAYRAADDIDQAAVSGVYPDMIVRTRVRADTGYVVEKITQAIDLLLFAHGAGSFADSSPLQRIWRDSAVAARHAVVLPTVGYEVYGKALLGVENNVTALV